MESNWYCSYHFRRHHHQKILAMKKIIFTLMSLSVWISINAQTTSGFKLLRYDEDYSSLKNDTNRSYWYSRTKFQPLSKNGHTYLSFGGEYRYQYFYFKNEGWGKLPNDKDGYLLSRLLGHADLHVGTSFRTFIQIQTSLANSKISSSPVDENPLDIHQVFGDGVIHLSEGKKLTLRAGRQELSYGSQRLVSPRDGPNNRQSFDALRTIYTTKHFNTDVFFSQYVVSRKGILDDRFNSGVKFWGIYSVINKVPVIINADLYYFGLQKENATFDEGTANETRHSVGARLWNKIKRWEYDFEGVYQFGKFADKHISAWTLSSNTTYTFSTAKFKPSVNLKAELISGDEDSTDQKLNTFNPLFPRGAYFGYAALIGPSNLIDVHPSVVFDLLPTLKLSLDWDLFKRYSTADGVYGPSGALIFSGKNSNSRSIGDQYSAILFYTPNPFIYFRGEFTWFNAGDFLKQVGPGKDIVFTGVTMQFKF